MIKLLQVKMVKRNQILSLLAVAALGVIVATGTTGQAFARHHVWWIPRGGSASYTGPSSDAPELRCSPGFGYSGTTSESIQC